MPQRKTLDEQIAAVKEEAKQKEHRLTELLQKKKEQERKARTKRLIERGAIVESLIDGAEALTNEQFQAIAKAAFSTVNLTTETPENMPKQYDKL